MRKFIKNFRCNIVNSIFIFLIIIFTSCSTKKVVFDKNNSKSDTLYVNKLVLSNNNFYNIILDAKNNFKKVIGKEPNVIKVELIGNIDKPQFEIICLSNLYENRDDKSFFKEKFIGGVVVDKTLVLFKNSEDFSVFKKIIKRKNKKEKFNFYFGSKESYSCERLYEIRDEKFILINNKCPLEAIN